MTRLCARCGAPIPDPTQDAKLCPDCLLAVRRESVVRARICKQCGRSFPGGPRAQHCPECRAERAKQAKARYKRKGSADRPLGSTDLCARCGAEYTVEGARQRYCPRCAADAVRETVRPHKREYNAADPDRRTTWRIAYKGSRVRCVICGKEFVAHSSTNVCSPECRKTRRKQMQALNAQKKKERSNQEIKKEASMVCTYEIYEDNGGYLHFVILEDGSPTHIFSDWVNPPVPGILISAMMQLKEDPTAHKFWEGDLVLDLEAHGEPRTVEDLYADISREDTMIAWAGEDCNLEHIDPARIGANGRTSLGLDGEEY